MARISVKVQGIEELAGKLKENVTMDDVKRIVQKNGADLTTTMKRQTTLAYVKGYSTGDTAGSIQMTLKNGGMTAEVATGTNYSPYVEYGTRYMSPEPIVQPSLDVIEPKFLNDLSRVMK